MESSLVQTCGRNGLERRGAIVPGHERRPGRRRAQRLEVRVEPHEQRLVPCTNRIDAAAPATKEQAQLELRILLASEERVVATA